MIVCCYFRHFVGTLFCRSRILGILQAKEEFRLGEGCPQPTQIIAFRKLGP